MEVDVEDVVDETHLRNAIVPYIQMVHEYNMHCVHMGYFQPHHIGRWRPMNISAWSGVQLPNNYLTITQVSSDIAREGVKVHNACCPLAICGNSNDCLLVVFKGGKPEAENKQIWIK